MRQDREKGGDDPPATAGAGAAASQVLSLVIFRLGAQWLALPTQVVREVAEVRTIRSIPRWDTGVLLGLVNLRGEFELCVSLEEILGRVGAHGCARDRDHQRTARLVVVEKGEARWVFPADEVSGVFHFAPGDFHASPVAPAAGADPAFTGMVRWLEKQVSCLDETVLFDTLKRHIA